MSSSQSRFATLPAEVDTPRSKWSFEHRHTTSFNAAELVPILMFPVIPGDTIKCNIRSFIRMSTPIHPVMDDAFADIYSFFVPHRLVWDHFEEFMGASNSQPWVEDVEYTIPQVISPRGGWSSGTIADHLGIPLGFEMTVSALPFRSIALIWNDWFRDVNLQNPAVFTKGDSTLAGSNGDDYVMAIQGGGKCPPVAKYHDYFTSALPSPQRGDPVTIAADLLEVGLRATSPYSAFRLNFYDNLRGLREGVLGLDPSGHVIALHTKTSEGIISGTGSESGDDIPGAQTYAIYRGGIAADGEGAFNLTVSDLRLALQAQVVLEKDARGGGRFTDILKSHFGVTNPDFRLQRAEFIGSQHFAINMSQVLQTSETTDNSPQGNTAAFSATGHYGDGFLYSATEPGYIFTFVAIRNKQSYQQGLAREWTKKRRFDFYYPEFNSIGEQAIYNREIFFGSSSNDGIFGYQERYAEYRYHPDLVTGELRSTYSQSLDVWHYADYYVTQPILSDGWIRATKNNIDRTLAVRSDVTSQFIGQFGFDFDVVRPMPLYSVPGVGLHF